jgi:hypothetical protein
MDLHVAVKRFVVNEIEPPVGADDSGKYVMRILMCPVLDTFSIARSGGACK